jgi:hypothetical protein
MRFKDGACTWEDIIDNDRSIHRNNFLIQRHALQILQPIDQSGNLQCWNDTLGGAIYPRLDYSKGFPNWWHLAHTSIKVPSEHVQDGKRYDAEVSLEHFYEVENYKNQVRRLEYIFGGLPNEPIFSHLTQFILPVRLEMSLSSFRHTTIRTHGSTLINSFASGEKLKRRQEVTVVWTVSLPIIQDAPTTTEATLLLHFCLNQRMHPALNLLLVLQERMLQERMLQLRLLQLRLLQLRLLQLRLLQLRLLQLRLLQLRLLQLRLLL